MQMVFGDRQRLLAPLAISALLVLNPAGVAVADSSSSAQMLAAVGTVERVSIDSDGAQLTRNSRGPNLSRHGRFVVFQTNAALSDSDTNGQEDVFLRDRVLGTTELISGTRGTARSGGAASISADGRYVSFLSSSSALSNDDDNGAHWDVFVRDVQTGDLTLVSTATDGTQRNADMQGAVISGDGSRVAFLTQARLSPADDDTAPVDEPWNRLDVYVHNIASGHTRLVSVNRHRDNFTGKVGLGGMSYDGRLVGFSWGNSGRDKLDVPAGYYVRNMAKRGSRLIWRENLNLVGSTYNGPVLSGNGRYAAFTSKSQRLDSERDYRLDDVARYDRRTGRLSLVSVGTKSTNANFDSYAATLSNSGRYVGFASEATNLVPGDDNDAIDAFRLDFSTHQMMLVSAALDGGPGMYHSGFGGGVAISADGQHVAFASFAPDLVPDDTNHEGDVFLWTAFD